MEAKWEELLGLVSLLSLLDMNLKLEMEKAARGGRPEVL